jgi:uncharacterized protein YkwD
MKSITLSMVLTSLLFVGCGETQTSPTTTELNQEELSVVVKSENQDMLEALNKARSITRDCRDGKGVVGPSKSLTWNDALYAAAYAHSSDMAQSDTFSHYGSGTASDITAINNEREKSYFYERIESNGYGNYTALGENIAGGQKNLDEVMEAWLKSPGHCANIMNDTFSEVGIAIVVEEDSTYGIYWTQNFGSK